MPKYLIIWNIGFGDNADVIEAEDEQEANEAAYQAWRDEAESNAEYRSEPLTEENAEDYGFESELEN